MLITEGYRQMNREIHERDPHFGRFAGRYAESLMKQMATIGATELLDYGAGKGVLYVWFGTNAPSIKVLEYDPAVLGKDGVPASCDVVACIATMEHVEPECVDEVLEHIHVLARRMAYFSICTVASDSHLLPDGRRPHLSVHTCEWWEDKLKALWGDVRIKYRGQKNFVAICQ